MFDFTLMLFHYCYADDCHDADASAMRCHFRRCFRLCHALRCRCCDDAAITPLILMFYIFAVAAADVLMLAPLMRCLPRAAAATLRCCCYYIFVGADDTLMLPILRCRYMPHEQCCCRHYCRCRHAATLDAAAFTRPPFANYAADAAAAIRPFAADAAPMLDAMAYHRPFRRRVALLFRDALMLLRLRLRFDAATCRFSLFAAAASRR